MVALSTKFSYSNKEKSKLMKKHPLFILIILAILSLALAALALAEKPPGTDIFKQSQADPVDKLLCNADPVDRIPGAAMVIAGTAPPGQELYSNDKTFVLARLVSPDINLGCTNCGMTSADSTPAAIKARESPLEAGPCGQVSRPKQRNTNLLFRDKRTNGNR